MQSKIKIMFKLISNALNSDSQTSSRRLITFMMASLAVVNVISLVMLAFKVALGTSGNAYALGAMDRLIQLMIIISVALFFLMGLITWQNITDAAKIVRGLPTVETKIDGTVTQTVTPAPETTKDNAE